MALTDPHTPGATPLSPEDLAIAALQGSAAALGRQQPRKSRSAPQGVHRCNARCGWARLQGTPGVLPVSMTMRVAGHHAGRHTRAHYHQHADDATTTMINMVPARVRSKTSARYLTLSLVRRRTRHRSPVGWLLPQGVRATQILIPNALLTCLNARGRSRTDTLLKAADFPATSAFAAPGARAAGSWSGARHHRGHLGCRCPPSALYTFPRACGGLARRQLESRGLQGLHRV